jgi:hypothetical protein
MVSASLKCRPRAELDLLGECREVAQGGVALEHVHLGRPVDGNLEEMVHHPDAVETAGIGRLHDILQDARDRRGAGIGESRDLQSDAHGTAAFGDERAL